MYIQLAGILVADLLAGDVRAVLHYHYFEVGLLLSGQALQQFVNFVGTVVYGYYNGIFHARFLIVPHRL